MFIDLEKPAPPKLFSAALLAEAEAKGKAINLMPTTSVEEVEQVEEVKEEEKKEEEDEAKSKASEEAMSALLVSPVPKREIVDAFAD